MDEGEIFTDLTTNKQSGSMKIGGESWRMRRIGEMGNIKWRILVPCVKKEAAATLFLLKRKLFLNRKY